MTAPIIRLIRYSATKNSDAATRATCRRKDRIHISLDLCRAGTATQACDRVSIDRLRIETEINAGRVCGDTPAQKYCSSQQKWLSRHLSAPLVLYLSLQLACRFSKLAILFPM